VITIVMDDQVEGKRVIREVQSFLSAIALLVSLFDRTEFDPWNSVYPPLNGPAPTHRVLLHEEVHANGDVVLLIERLSSDPDDAPEGQLS